MIAYVGEDDFEYVVKQVAEEVMLPYEKIDPISDAETLVRELLQGEFSQYMIDLNPFLDSLDDVAEIFGRFNQVTRSPVFFIAIGLSMESRLICRLRNAGFRFFVFSTTIGGMQRQLRDCFEGLEYAAPPLSAQAQFTQKSVETLQGHERCGAKSVSFLGVQSRIGTTTIAIQFAKFLLFCGYRACYIEAGKQGHIQTLPILFGDAKHDPDVCMVSFEQLDFFYDLRQIGAIRERDYDVFVYDYGSTESDDLRVDFLDKELKVFVSGSKPWEVGKMSPFLPYLNEGSSHCVFNFTGKNMRDAILQNMKPYDERTHFCASTFDPFTLNSLDGAMHEAWLLALSLEKQHQKHQNASKGLSFLQRRKGG